MGESFLVQYILEGAEKGTIVKPPSFNGFRLVTGPFINNGRTNTSGGTKDVSNTVYTLEALRTGSLVIPPAVAIVNGQPLQSNAVTIYVTEKPKPTVLPGAEMGNSAYYLKPGEDPYEKVKRNLFVRVTVSKKQCYTGEPLVATFNLYSSLESKSDIIKNPGFYGFTVYDMENLADNISSEQQINGQVFTVYTIRRVQLYPLQPGIFTIDPMLIKNTVTFSTKYNNKKAQQEITEGLSGSDADDKQADKDLKIVETETETPAIQVLVNGLPDKSKPDNYDGAVGRFAIQASLASDSIAMNEEGYFTITLHGSGNFIQTVAPAVEWPAGTEGFEPIITDNLDNKSVPLTGSRSFRFPFVCAKPGDYILPPVRFSFFNTDSNKYETVESKPMRFTVSTAVKKTNLEETNKTSIREASEKSVQRAGLIVLGIVAIVLLYWIFQKKKPVTKADTAPPSLPAVHEILQPAEEALDTESGSFYTALQLSIWHFAGHYFNKDSSTLSKTQLRDTLLAQGISSEPADKLYWLLEHCETVLFTQAGDDLEKTELLETARTTLEQIVSDKKL